MGVGMPFGVGAKIAKPDSQVIVLHGDGSFGLNAMELDTAMRHNIPVLVIVSLNGGWTADPDKNKPGRDLGYTRYDEIARALGAYAELVKQAHANPIGRNVTMALLLPPGPLDPIWKDGDVARM